MRRASSGRSRLHSSTPTITRRRLRRHRRPGGNDQLDLRSAAPGAGGVISVGSSPVPCVRTASATPSSNAPPASAPASNARSTTCWLPHLTDHLRHQHSRRRALDELDALAATATDPRLHERLSHLVGELRATLMGDDAGPRPSTLAASGIRGRWRHASRGSPPRCGRHVEQRGGERHGAEHEETVRAYTAQRDAPARRAQPDRRSPCGQGGEDCCRARRRPTIGPSWRLPQVLDVPGVGAVGQAAAPMFPVRPAWRPASTTRQRVRGDPAPPRCSAERAPGARSGCGGPSQPASGWHSCWHSTTPAALLGAVVAGRRLQAAIRASTLLLTVRHSCGPAVRCLRPNGRPSHRASPRTDLMAGVPTIRCPRIPVATVVSMVTEEQAGPRRGSPTSPTSPRRRRRGSPLRSRDRPRAPSAARRGWRRLLDDNLSPAWSRS